MKKVIRIIYLVLLAAVLIGKISGLFLHYSDETNKILDTIMFSMIGFFYLVTSWAFDKKIIKITLAVCGIYLIVMNFIPDFNVKSIIGIICIITPLIIGRFSSKNS